MKREEVLKQLWQLREHLEEQEILEYELQKKERLLKLTVEEAQADYLQEKAAKFYSTIEYNQQSQSEKQKNKETILLFVEAALTALAVILIFMGLPLWEAAALWLLTLAGTKLLMKKPTNSPVLEEILEAAKSSEDYQSLEHSLLADYLKLEISFLQEKAEQGRKRLTKKSVNQAELIHLIELLEQGETEPIEQAIKLLD